MRKLGIICMLVAAMPNLAGCESSWSKDPQFQKQLKRAQECRQLQDKLAQASGAGREEITNAMKAIGCTAPAAARSAEQQG
jgi:crotonobetainyl-CoA:carnitine CoA-transferase CaiB-like acyl-CoA transferase